MKRNAIYFPYMSIPQSKWLTQSLFYWDKINSIIPMEYSYKPSKLGKYMESLIKANLVEPINPADYVYKMPNFDRAFLDYVDDADYPIPPDLHFRKKLRTTRIHIQKLGPLAYELCERNLARHIDYRDGNWYHVEKFTASQYMAYLAASLARLPEINSNPITDSITHLNSFCPVTPPHSMKLSKLLKEIDEIRAIILKDFLPFPLGPIDPVEIANFKEDYRMELLNFRHHIECFVLHSVSIDADLRSLAIDRFISDNQDKIEGLTNSMKSMGWKNIKLGQLIYYAPSAATMAGGIATNNIYTAIAGALGFAATVKSFQENGSHNNFRNENMAFAVLAKEKASHLERMRSFLMLGSP